MIPIGELGRERIFGESYVRDAGEALHISRCTSHSIKNVNYNKNLDGKLASIPPSLLSRHHCEVFTPRTNKDTPIVSRGEPNSLPDASSYIYGGYLFPHYGHFIVETLSRLWLPIGKDDLVVFHNSSSRHRSTMIGIDHFRGFSQSILGAVGIHNAISIDSFLDYRSADIVMPWPAFQTRYSIHPNHIEFLRRVGRRIVKMGEGHAKQKMLNEAPKYIYISRARLKKSQRPLANEEVISQIFEDAGFATVYPEEYSLAEQISMYERSEIIAGFAGSAFHTLGFCDSPKKVIMLSCMQRINANMALQSLARRDDCLVSFIECKSYYCDSLLSTVFEILPQSAEKLGRDIESIVRPRFGC